MLDLPPDAGTRVYVAGHILAPTAYLPEALRARFPPHTIDVSYLRDDQHISGSFTGVRLYDVFARAGVKTDPEVLDDNLSLYIVVTGRDGYQATIAWAEIDPEFGNHHILLAYAQNGLPIVGKQGPFRLIVPRDKRGGRYVMGVARLDLMDAPRAER
jgi:DMSO/TMAO reductase YedYZ molybdopterin-dependent catalytic subunit